MLLPPPPGAQALPRPWSEAREQVDEQGAVTLLAHRGGLRAGFAGNSSSASQETAGRLYLSSPRVRADIGARV